MGMGKKKKRNKDGESLIWVQLALCTTTRLKESWMEVKDSEMKQVSCSTGCHPCNYRRRAYKSRTDPSPFRNVSGGL